MITVRTMGGIGNQMFQYAFGLAQAKKLGVDWRIDCGPGNDLNTYRPFNLRLFQIQVPVFEHVSREPVVKEKSLRYDANLAVKDGDTLYGYWQSEKYFESVRNEVRSSFRSVKPWPAHALDYGDLIQSEGNRSLMIGIRRDDYVNNPKHSDFHGVMPLEYYWQGIDMVRQHLGADPIIFVFTDDPEWVQQNWHFKGCKTHYFVGDRTVPGHMGREDVDLGLMSLCNSAIIANGTFHWWGAWLGEERSAGLRIAPKQWFRDPTAQAETGDIVPNRWHKI